MVTNNSGVSAVAVDTPHSDAVPEGETISAKERNARLARDIQLAQATLDEVTQSGDITATRYAATRLDDAKAALYEANIGLADGWAKRFRRASDQRAWLDYRDAAREGLWEAITCWDADKGSLASWAWPRIKRTLFGEVINNEHHLSTHSFQYRPRILAAVETLREAGEPLTAERIALECEQPVSLVTHVMLMENREGELHLDRHIGGWAHPNQTLHDVVAEIPVETPADVLSVEDQRTMFSDLSMAELWVTLRTTGVDGAPKDTIQTVASSMGRSRETPRKYARNAERIIAETIAQRDAYAPVVQVSTPIVQASAPVVRVGPSPCYTELTIF